MRPIPPGKQSHSHVTILLNFPGVFSYPVAPIAESGKHLLFGQWEAFAGL